MAENESIYKIDTKKAHSLKEYDLWVHSLIKQMFQMN